MRVLGRRAWNMRFPYAGESDVASQVEEVAEDAGSTDAEGNKALRTLVARGRLLMTSPHHTGK